MVPQLKLLELVVGCGELWRVVVRSLQLGLPRGQQNQFSRYPDVRLTTSVHLMHSLFTFSSPSRHCSDRGASAQALSGVHVVLWRGGNCLAHGSDMVSTSPPKLSTVSPNKPLGTLAVCCRAFVATIMMRHGGSGGMAAARAGSTRSVRMTHLATPPPLL